MLAIACGSSHGQIAVNSSVPGWEEILWGLGLPRPCGSDRREVAGITLEK